MIHHVVFLCIVLVFAFWSWNLLNCPGSSGVFRVIRLQCEAKIRRLRELEVLLADCKSTNPELIKEFDAIGGDSLSPGRGRTRKDLAEDVEVDLAAKIES